MKKALLLIVSILLSFPLFSQSDTTLFSQAIRIDLNKYKKQTALAYRKGDFERGQFLFDSLVHNRLTGTKFDFTRLKKSNGRKLDITRIEKPIILITYSSWCITSKGEIPAINKLARKYGKDVQFVVLFWDRKHNMKKIARKFSSRIITCYAHESYRNDEQIVAALKHTLGFPTTYFFDENLQVIDIRRCGMKLCPKKTPYEKAFAINYNSYVEGLSTIIIDKDLSKDMLAVK